MNKHPIDGANCAGLMLAARTTGPLFGYDRSAGEGQPVHFLHGNGFCGLTLAPFASHMTSSDQPLFFSDLPGHGGTAGPGEPVQPDWNRMADQVADSIAALSQAPVVGVGHSMGGVVSLLAAARYPQLFARTVLLDPVLFGREVIFYQRLMRKTGLWQRSALVKSVTARRSQWPDEATMLKDLRKKKLYRDWESEALEAFVRFATRPVRATDDAKEAIELACAPAWEASIFGSYPRGLWKAVRQIQVPVDIITATDSYPFIRPAVKRAVAVNPNIHHHVFDGGHCFPMENSELAAASVSDILADSRQVV